MYNRKNKDIIQCCVCDKMGVRCDFIRDLCDKYDFGFYKNEIKKDRMCSDFEESVYLLSMGDIQEAFKRVRRSVNYRRKINKEGNK